MVPSFLQLPYHLASNSLALFLYFLVSLSLSLSLCIVLWQFPSNNVICWWGSYSDNLSNNHLLHSVRWPSHRAMSITLERTWKDMSAKWKEHACKWKEDERMWMQIGMKMKGTWRIIKGNEYRWKEHERKMTGKWQKINANWEEDACKWKEHEGRCMQIDAKWKEHEVLPKHLKPTKQLLDPFPSLFRNGFWLHVGSRTCWFHLISTKPWKANRPTPKGITITATTQM